MNIFIDDKRPVPTDTTYTVARTFERAELYIKFTNIDFCSTDYNLGEEKTGLDILKLMIKLNKFPNHLNIHSTHITGQYEMKDYADEHFPKSVTITTNSL